MKKRYYLLSAMALAFMTTSCGDDAVVADLSVQSTMAYGDQLLELNRSYSLGDYDIQFTSANYYLGGFALNSGDTRQDREDTYILAGPDAQTTPVFSDIDVETGISEVSFFVGVGPEENNQTEAEFLARSTEDPLSVKDPAMHWNWMTGYRFIRLDGVIDDNKDGVISADETTIIAYHIGTDALLTGLRIATGLTPLNEGNNVLTLQFDVQAFLSGVDLSVESDRDSHTMNNMELAERLVANLSTGGIQFRLN